MKRIATLMCIALTAGLLASGCGLFTEKRPFIVYTADASSLEKLAAREIRRYIYLRSGELLEMVAEHPELPDNRDMILVATKNRAIVRQLAKTARFSSLLLILDPDE